MREQTGEVMPKRLSFGPSCRVAVHKARRTSMIRPAQPGSELEENEAAPPKEGCAEHSRWDGEGERDGEQDLNIYVEVVTHFSGIMLFILIIHCYTNKYKT
jgi:hypothetical protein